VEAKVHLPLLAAHHSHPVRAGLQRQGRKTLLSNKDYGYDQFSFQSKGDHLEGRIISFEEGLGLVTAFILLSLAPGCKSSGILRSARITGALRSHRREISKVLSPLMFLLFLLSFFRQADTACVTPWFRDLSALTIQVPKPSDQHVEVFQKIFKSIPNVSKSLTTFRI
jgi:hypothetical protein